MEKNEKEMDGMSGCSFFDCDHRSRYRSCVAGSRRGNAWKIRGGDISEIQELTAENETGSTEKKETETAVAGTTEQIKDVLPQKKTKQTAKKKTLKDNGQTYLDVSQGNIRITKDGATGGGLAEDETNLNPKGYWITGTTDSNNIVVEPGVKTELTLDSVSVTSNMTTKNCLNVSHADVVITLIGENLLYSKAGTVGDDFNVQDGNAITKNGMDGFLTIQCQNAEKEGHVCTKETCGSLTAQGDPSLYHAGGIGNAFGDTKKTGEAGFCNFTIKGGIIDVLAGKHSPGIGSSCWAEAYGGCTKDIRITGGIVTAKGNASCSGIGSGYGSRVDGIYISGGYVEAQGGSNAPGIGASKGQASMESKNIQISGGDTVVIAMGDQATDMPGIGSAGGNENVSNVNAVPDFGYQGYIQDGTSLTDYSFMDGTPFKEKTAIQVGKFYTKVYFGPFRDENEIENNTKEQIGANHVISKSGGEKFTEQQLKGLTKVTGKQENGTDFPEEDLTFEDKKQIEAINQAKTEGKVGEFPLTFTTPNGTKTTVKVYLKADGTDAAKIEPDRLIPTIGADNFTRETGGNEFTEQDVRNFAEVKGKDSNGTTYDIGDFQVDTEELEIINKAKTEGKAGKFPLTFTSKDGEKAVITVTLYGEYDKITTNTDSGEVIKANHIISKTGGDGFTKEQLKEISMVKAIAGDDTSIERDLISFPDQTEIETINRAKKAGQIGEYPLTFATPDGTTATVTVYLRDDGTDGVQWEIGNESLGANDAVHPTGGKGFSIEELTEICQAKGKDKNGDNTAPEIDSQQLKKLNQAKEAGRTGVFEVTFSLSDGTKTSVKVTLTGEHKVSFDSNGGDYQPKDQTVIGGRTAVEPEEPKKEGYMFEGWYYTDEAGNESLWDFDTPVNESMTLRAKWSKVSTTAPEKDTSKPKETEKKGKKEDSWNYKEIQTEKKRAVAKTGEENHLPWMLACMAGAAGIGICVFFWKRKID